MAGEVTPALLRDAKRHSGITWEDGDTDARMISILRRGMAYLDSRIGPQPSYEREGEAKGLLMDYARYHWAGAGKDFESDYLSDLLLLSLRTEAGRMEESEAAEEDGTDTGIL